MRIGVLAPGAMGSALGRTWQGAGHRVCTTVAGRSERTRRLAEGLELLADVDEVVATAELVVSVVPPQRALQNARELAEACTRRGAGPVLADLNAVSPAVVGEIAATFTASGARALDGSLSGPPPSAGKHTTLYLTGTPELGPQWAEQLATEELSVHWVGEQIGAASAVKMSTAALYKGISALWLQSLASAERYGVCEVVVADLTRGLGRTRSQVAQELAVAAAKSDRFPAEMREIAATQQQAGLGEGLYAAIAEVYERVHHTALASSTPEEAAETSDLSEVIARLSERSPGRSPRSDSPNPGS